MPTVCFASQMILNHFICQGLEYPRLAPDFLPILWFCSMDGVPIHLTCWQISRLAALPFPSDGKNIFSSAKLIPKERDLSFWCVNFTRGGRWRLWV